MTESYERGLGRVEGKLDSLTLTVAADIADRKHRDRDLNERLATVEKRQYTFMGASGVVGSIVAFVANKLF